MAEDFRSKLRRLRRERGLEPSASEPAGERGLPSWMRARLDREHSLAPPDADLRRSGAPQRLQRVGDLCWRETRFPVQHRHGEWQLAEVDAASGADLALLGGDERLETLDLRGAVYLDIETNGLAGGSGTYPFQVGLGRFDGDEFELWQGFLEDPGRERVLLEEVARRVADSSGVVSFFGKVFDRHRLEDKMRHHGVAPPFAALPHLDLYHPCRRLYRASLPDARLATMELELCGLVREDDLPGSFAPAAWLDFLNERPHRLEDVFRHNEDDVLSLVTLAAHIGRTRAEARADGALLAGDARARALGLAGLFRARREREDELRWLERAQERGSFSRELELWHAHALRLAGRGEEALALYTELVAFARDAVAARAALEEAKLAERIARDPERARVACERGLVLVARHLTGAEGMRAKAALEQRILRLGRASRHSGAAGSRASGEERAQ